MEPILKDIKDIALDSNYIIKDSKDICRDVSKLDINTMS